MNVRDWLYVEDHCKAIDLILHKGRVGEVYNIGGHNEMRNIDIVKIICKALGKPESLITYVSGSKVVKFCIQRPGARRIRHSRLLCRPT